MNPSLKEEVEIKFVLLFRKDTKQYLGAMVIQAYWRGYMVRCRLIQRIKNLEDAISDLKRDKENMH